jgi:hypothetical protein
MELGAARMQSALLHDGDVAVAQTNIVGTVLSSAVCTPRHPFLGLMGDHPQSSTSPTA